MLLAEIVDPIPWMGRFDFQAGLIRVFNLTGFRSHVLAVLKNSAGRRFVIHTNPLNWSISKFDAV